MSVRSPTTRYIASKRRASSEYGIENGGDTRLWWSGKPAGWVRDVNSCRRVGARSNQLGQARRSGGAGCNSYARPYVLVTLVCSAIILVALSLSFCCNPERSVIYIRQHRRRVATILRFNISFVL